MDELVSVIVPVFKVEDLLQRCVDSIVSQTHTNLEIILIDDGSPDRCGAICDAYQADDARVTVIHQANAGLSAARNAGLDAATGEFITFVDSDDWINVDMIRALVSTADRHDADIAVCGFSNVGGSEPEPDLSGSEHLRVLTNIQALSELRGPNALNMVVSWGKLYRRDLFTGARFPVGRVHEDLFTTHLLFWRARRVVVMADPLYNYWQREGSITATDSSGRRRDSRDAYTEQAEFFKSVGMKDEAAAVFQKVFWMHVLERRRMQELGDVVAARDSSAKMRQLKREFLKGSTDLTLRARVEFHAMFPTVGSMLGTFKRRERRQA